MAQTAYRLAWIKSSRPLPSRHCQHEGVALRAVTSVCLLGFISRNGQQGGPCMHVLSNRVARVSRHECRLADCVVPAKNRLPPRSTGVEAIMGSIAHSQTHEDAHLCTMLRLSYRLLN